LLPTYLFALKTVIDYPVNFTGTQVLPSQSFSQAIHGFCPKKSTTFRGPPCYEEKINKEITPVQYKILSRQGTS